mgnify:CR=1 FL=1
MVGGSSSQPCPHGDTGEDHADDAGERFESDADVGGKQTTGEDFEDQHRSRGAEDEEAGGELTLYLPVYKGIPLDTSTVIIMPMILGLAVDDTIHYLVRYHSEFKKDLDKHLEQTTKRRSKRRGGSK